MLQWFINEQVEEEKNATEIVEQLKLIDAHGTAVLMLDHRLGKRGGLLSLLNRRYVLIDKGPKSLYAVCIERRCKHTKLKMI